MLGVCQATLVRWEKAGKIRTITSVGGQRYYSRGDVQAIIDAGRSTDTTSQAPTTSTERRIIYARVSSSHQAADLERQVKDLQDAYPDHETIQDIGSGINFARKGFTALLAAVLRREVSQVVVAHRDRLCRFAIDLMERVFEAMGTKLVVHRAGEADREEGGGDTGRDDSTHELADDLLAIVNVFVAKNNGRRSAANRRARKLRQAAVAEEAASEARDTTQVRPRPTDGSAGTATTGTKRPRSVFESTTSVASR
jgi:predicted site-specific integrase-resolvase